VPVDFDEGHVVYVWIDALSNYITFIGYEPEGASEPAFNEIWPCDVHIIGKDILRFHTIIWPIILKALDIEMPKAIFGHPWLLVGEGKMSKSKGNVIYPDDVVAEYGLDALRYYLLREMPFGSDGTYTDELITERINTELANVYGNLVSRTLAMLEQYFGGVIPEPSETTGEDTELIAALSEAPGIVAAKMDEFKTADALSAIFTVLRRSNKYIDETMPWILAKSDESKGRLATVLYNLADSIRILSSLLSAFMPVSTEKALSALGTHATDWDSLAPGKLESGMKISPAGRLFERIGPSKENKEQPKAASEELISIEDFAKAKIVIGKILTARQHPNAENLLVFTVDIGEESPRQVVSGIAKFYEPESLVGNIVCVAANLKPAKFRGEKSEGMFLMADGEGKPEFLTIRDDSVPVGTIIK
jgi:methionyl-tRNA synthetase